MYSLYKKSANDTVQVYTIEESDDGFIIEWGQVGGVMQDKEIEVIPKGGRNWEQQLDLMVNSRVKKKLDAGYKHTYEEAMLEGATNSIGMLRPMLAKKYGHKYHKSQVSLDNCYVQYKYDGHRCLVHNDGQRITAYSRNGKRIETIDHILMTLDIPTGMTLDGELYIHGVKLQSLTSLIKRHQPGTLELKYMVYDVIGGDRYSTRHQILQKLNLKDPCILVPTTYYDSTTSIVKKLDKAMEEGYEGLILRGGEWPYECGKRSPGLIKVKSFMDKSFPIIDIIPSVDGWARLVFDGFKATAPGTVYEKQRILLDKEKHIGRKARIEYASVTDAGKPFHGICTLIHD
jgi:ATP-dependent DNA ligase